MADHFLNGNFKVNTPFLDTPPQCTLTPPHNIYRLRSDPQKDILHIFMIVGVDKASEAENLYKTYGDSPCSVAAFAAAAC